MGKRKNEKKRRKGGKKHRLTARNADRHDLYQRTVQEPEVDVDLIERVFKKENGRRPLSLREDFCGTALISAAWAASRKDRTALGVDLDRPTLEWGYLNNVQPLGKAAKRVTLLEKNVLDVQRPKVDVVCAFNFSYCVFHERRDLLAYFRSARRSLEPDGAFLLDNHAGIATLDACWDERECKGYTYVWEQKRVDGITHRGTRYIHFFFPDGSKLKKAFTYDWRMWSLPELVDLAREAGFRRTDVYVEPFDEDGDSVAGLRKVKRFLNEDSWTPYLVCWK